LFKSYAVKKGKFTIYTISPVGPWGVVSQGVSVIDELWDCKANTWPSGGTNCKWSVVLGRVLRDLIYMMKLDSKCWFRGLFSYGSMYW